MSFKSLLIWFSTCFLFVQVQAQKSIADSIYTIKGIDVYGTRLEDFAVGASVQRFDSTALRIHKTESLSDLLNFSGVNIKSNGAGGLSSLMLRGGGSSHTAIVWNGLNIQSPMSGSLDFSIFPVSMFNSVKLQYGGSGTLFGSGAVAGVVHLSSGNLFSIPNSVSFTAGYGSANSRNGLVNLKLGNSRVASSLKVFFLSSDNDYEFYNSTKSHSPKERISNAGALQFGIIGDEAFRLTKSTSWNLSGWYQKSNKDLQTRMSNTIPDSSNQKDNQLYSSSNIKYAKDKFSINVKNGFLFGEIVYNDPVNDLKTNNHFNSFINELESRVKIASNHEALVGLNHTTEMAFSGDYNNKDAQRDRTSLFGSCKIALYKSRLKTVLSFRDEVVDHQVTPLVYSLGFDFAAYKKLTIKGNYSKNYKLPTLNDLFWAKTQFAEGNPNLKPESGWSGEFGIDYHISIQKFQLESSITLFQTYINDWIIWLPTLIDNASKWKPFNVDKGNTYGSEIKLATAIPFNRITLFVDGFYTYTHSRIYRNGSSEGQPMIYTPSNKISGSFTFKYQNLFVRYSHTYTGERFIDNVSIPLHYYNLGDISSGYQLKLKSVRAEFNFKVHNIWNTDYQLTASYAMPLRYYSLALTVDINSK